MLYNVVSLTDGQVIQQYINNGDSLYVLFYFLYTE